MISIKEILNLLKDCKKINILGHINPDGDCIGSSLALKMILQKYSIESSVVLRKPSKKFSYIKGYQQISEQAYDDADAFIVLDCADIDRIKPYREIFDKCKVTINIDHHFTNTKFAKHNYVYDISSTGEIITEMALKDNLLDRDIATSLYTAIISDTGAFKHPNVSKRTMQLAGELIDTGIDFQNILRINLYMQSISSLKAIELALSRLKLISNGKFATAFLTYEDIASNKLLKEDMENIVQMLNDIEGIEGCMFVSEYLPNKYKLSFRANSILDVAKIAMQFGGGGHIKAAGAPTEMPYQEIISKVEGLVNDQLNQESLVL